MPVRPVAPLPEAPLDGPSPAAQPDEPLKAVVPPVGLLAYPRRLGGRGLVLAGQTIGC
jgi:hypothetical protein